MNTLKPLDLQPTWLDKMTDAYWAFVNSAPEQQAGVIRKSLMGVAVLFLIAANL